MEMWIWELFALQYLSAGIQVSLDHGSFLSMLESIFKTIQAFKVHYHATINPALKKNKDE